MENRHAPFDDARQVVQHDLRVAPDVEVRPLQVEAGPAGLGSDRGVHAAQLNGLQKDTLRAVVQDAGTSTSYCELYYYTSHYNITTYIK